MLKGFRFFCFVLFCFKGPTSGPKPVFFLKFYLFIFIYLWLCWGFVSVRGLSLVVASGGPLFIAVRGPLTVAASLVAEHRLQTRRLSSCGSRA